MEQTLLKINQKYNWSIQVFVIFLIIGLSCLLNGCNPNLNTECFVATKFHGNVTEKINVPKTCTHCASYKHEGPNKKCVKKISVQCFNAYVCAQTYPYPYLYSYNNTFNDNEHCCLQTAKKQSEAIANNSYLKYSIGESVNWYRQNGTHQCIKFKELYIIWMVGAGFLMACCVTIICVAILMLYEFLLLPKKQYNNVLQSTIEIEIDVNNCNYSQTQL